MGNPEASPQLGFDEFQPPKPKEYKLLERKIEPLTQPPMSESGSRMRTITDPSESGRTYEVPDKRRLS